MGQVRSERLRSEGAETFQVRKLLQEARRIVVQNSAGDARYRGGTRNELLMDNLAKALIKVGSKLKLPRCVAVRDVGNTEWLCLVRSDVDAVRRAVHTTDQAK